MKVLQYLYICSITNCDDIPGKNAVLQFSPLYSHQNWNYAHNSENQKLMYIETYFFYSISMLMYQRKDSMTAKL